MLPVFAAILFGSTFLFIVGFLKKPEDLERFLEQEGYVEADQDERDEEVRVYENPRSPLTLFYYLKLPEVEDDEEPNWQRAGFRVVSELNINYHRDYWEESRAFAEKFVAQFPDTVTYEPGLGYFWTTSENA